MNFIELLKWSWQDAKDPTHNCLNEYSYERGKQQWNLFIPKDEYFEKECFEILSKVYGCGLKKILVDILIPNLKGHTTQLDVVFINRNGIYVIESKNFSCYLEGNNTDDKWVRKEFNGKTNKTDNPVIQNTNHIKCLSSLFPSYPDSYFKNIVVFANTCKLTYVNNTDLPYETEVVNYSNLKDTVRGLIKNGNIILSDEEIYSIYDELSKYARYSDEARRKHIEYVNRLQN